MFNIKNEIIELHVAISIKMGYIVYKQCSNAATKQDIKNYKRLLKLDKHILKFQND